MTLQSNERDYDCQKWSPSDYPAYKNLLDDLIDGAGYDWLQMISDTGMACNENAYKFYKAENIGEKGVGFKVVLSFD